jgi:hypothetical protein
MTHPTPPNAALMCRRDADGRIVALTRQTLTPEKIKMGAWQAVSSADPEVQAFVQQVSTQTEALSQTDTGLARVLEDLIDVLITRGMLQFTDLPEAAQAKLLERRQTRAKLPHRLELLSDDSEGDGVRL